jgi:hypothetical protein
MGQPITGGVTFQSQQVLKRLRDSVDPRSARLRRVIADMEKAVEELEAQAKDGWPVDRNTKGKPTRKKHGQKHSVDLFGTKMTLTGRSIIATVYNTAPYGYYIKSVMTGETTRQQRERHIWRDGVPQDRYEAQRRIGTKRSAFVRQMRTPGRKMARKLSRELEADLVAMLQGVL